ncbi:MAG: isoamylase early set domain-containing protein [Bacteroidales bacterium]
MSIHKKYLKGKKVCRATFKLEANKVNTPEKVFVVGDFNDWNEESTPMKKLKDGSFSISIDFPLHTIYQFRYLIDGSHWENDDAADNYEQSPWGSYNSVIIIESE